MNSDDIKILIKAINKSAIKAFANHYEITDGDWLLNTPEYWYTSHVSLGIKNALPKFSVYIENSISEFRHYSGPKLGRPTKRLQSGKADITIWKYWNEDKWEPKTIIEIKRAWNWDKKLLGGDVDRLRGALLETKKIKTAFFVIMSDEEDKKISAQEILKNRCKHLGDEIQKYLDKDDYPIRVERFCKISKYYDEDKSRAAVFTYKLSVDNRKRKVR